EQPNVTTLDSSVNYQTHLPNTALPELGQPNAIEYQSQVELPSVSPLDSSIRYQAQLLEVAQPSPVEYQSQLQTLNGLPQY
ncbi:hypothetical protein ACSTKE_00155, partial [Vibrio parahaemolyticus]